MADIGLLQHARDRERRAGVDRDDARVRMRRAQEDEVRLASRIKRSMDRGMG